MDEEAYGDSRFELIYDKFRRKGCLFRKFATFKEQWTIFRKVPKESTIWFYNLNTLNAFLFVLLKVFKPSVQRNIIVLDFTPVSKGFGLNDLYLKFINSAHGRICLANSPLFKQKNSILLPGVVPANEKNRPILIKPSLKFLLSGALNETIAQTAMVLKVFSQLPQCELHITGIGGNIDMMREYARKHSNIIYHGQLPYDEYISLLHTITIQLSTRDPKMPENSCNFPSKIIEALLHNRAVLTTIHYPQLKDIKVLECAESRETYLKEYIEKLSQCSDDELLIYVNQGDKVKQMFSTEVWEEAMMQIENNK